MAEQKQVTWLIFMQVVAYLNWTIINNAVKYLKEYSTSIKTDPGKSL